MDTETTMLDEIIQHRETNTAQCHLDEELKIVKPRRTGSRVIVTRGRGGAEEGCWLKCPSLGNRFWTAYCTACQYIKIMLYALENSPDSTS
jgi:hypothetical protein